MLPRPTLAEFRRRLAGVDALPQLALLGVISGLFTGMVIVAFRQLIELPLSSMLGGNPEDFESLEPAMLFLLTFGGAVILGLVMHRLDKDERQVGVVHVIERFQRHQGHLPLRNAVVQFLGGAFAMISGQSVGREGPAIHLGAAASSWLGTRMRLPNNSMRILVGCGTAAAIAASFNTPLAGVIFAIEVVLLEYTVASFTPIVIAAVTATIVTHFVYGNAPAFSVPAIQLTSLWELPYLMLFGLVIGVLGTMFIRLTAFFARYSEPALWVRMALIGLLSGLAYMFIPQAAGIGYDTVDGALLGQVSLTILAAALAAKFVLTALCTGWGMPGGLIGPVVFFGACAGGLMGYIGSFAFPELSSSPGFYVIVGMAGMMSAVLQAPLASLIAVMEMTANPNILLPAMLVIVVANLTASELFRSKSVFYTLLEERGFKLQQDPLSQALHRSAVGSVMVRSVVQSDRVVTESRARYLVNQAPEWILLTEEGTPSWILAPSDLAAYLSTLAAPVPEEEEADSSDETADIQEAEPEPVDLLKIPAQRKDVRPIDSRATLQEAREMFDRTGTEALVVTRAEGSRRILGVLTQADLEASFRRKLTA